MFYETSVNVHKAEPTVDAFSAHGLLFCNQRSLRKPEGTTSTPASKYRPLQAPEAYSMIEAYMTGHDNYERRFAKTFPIASRDEKMPHTTILHPALVWHRTT